MNDEKRGKVKNKIEYDSREDIYRERYRQAMSKTEVEGEG